MVLVDVLPDGWLEEPPDDCWGVLRDRSSCAIPVCNVPNDGIDQSAGAQTYDDNGTLLWMTLQPLKRAAVDGTAGRTGWRWEGRQVVCPLEASGGFGSH